jgi:hypothetical protein
MFPRLARPIRPVSRPHTGLRDSIMTVQEALSHKAAPVSLNNLVGLVPKSGYTYMPPIGLHEVFTRWMPSATAVLDHAANIVEIRNPRGNRLHLPAEGPAFADREKPLKDGDASILLNFDGSRFEREVVLRRKGWVRNDITMPQLQLARRSLTKPVKMDGVQHDSAVSRKQVDETYRIARSFDSTRIEYEERTMTSSTDYWRRTLRLIGANDKWPPALALTLSGPLGLLSLLPGIPVLGEESESAQRLIQAWYQQISDQSQADFGPALEPEFSDRDYSTLGFHHDTPLDGAFTLMSTATYQDLTMPQIKMIAYRVRGTGYWEFLVQMYLPVSEDAPVPLAIDLAWMINDVPVLRREGQMPKIADEILAQRP